MVDIWTASSEFGTYRLCEQRRFRRACASTQSRQNLRCSLRQAVSQEDPSDRKPDPWPLWMAWHAQLKYIMTECWKTQIRLTGLIWSGTNEKFCLVCLAGPAVNNNTEVLFRVCLVIYRVIKWAASREFVSSSIPSWQTLTAHAQPFRGARDLAFCLKVPLDSLLVWASSEGSGETARMRRLAWTFAARIGYKYQIRLTRSKYLHTWVGVHLVKSGAKFAPWVHKKEKKKHSNCFQTVIEFFRLAVRKLAQTFILRMFQVHLHISGLYIHSVDGCVWKHSYMILNSYQHILYRHLICT